MVSRARRQKVAARESELVHSSSRTAMHVIVVLFGVFWFPKHWRLHGARRVLRAVTIGRDCSVLLKSSFPCGTVGRALSLFAGDRGGSPCLDGAHGPVVHERVARIEDARCAAQGFRCRGLNSSAHYNNSGLAASLLLPPLPSQRWHILVRVLYA